MKTNEELLIDYASQIKIPGGKMPKVDDMRPRVLSNGLAISPEMEDGGVDFTTVGVALTDVVANKISWVVNAEPNLRRRAPDLTNTLWGQYGQLAAAPNHLAVFARYSVKDIMNGKAESEIVKGLPIIRELAQLIAVGYTGQPRDVLGQQRAACRTVASTRKPSGSLFFEPEMRLEWLNTPRSDLKDNAPWQPQAPSSAPAPAGYTAHKISSVATAEEGVPYQLQVANSPMSVMLSSFLMDVGSHKFMRKDLIGHGTQGTSIDAFGRNELRAQSALVRMYSQWLKMIAGFHVQGIILNWRVDRQDYVVTRDVLANKRKMTEADMLDARISWMDELSTEWGVPLLDLLIARLMLATTVGWCAGRVSTWEWPEILYEIKPKSQRDKGATGFNATRGARRERNVDLLDVAGWYDEFYKTEEYNFTGDEPPPITEAGRGSFDMIAQWAGAFVARGRAVGASSVWKGWWGGSASRSESPYAIVGFPSVISERGSTGDELAEVLGYQRTVAYIDHPAAGTRVSVRTAKKETNEGKLHLALIPEHVTTATMHRAYLKPEIEYLGKRSETDVVYTISRTLRRAGISVDSAAEEVERGAWGAWTPDSTPATLHAPCSRTRDGLLGYVPWPAQAVRELPWKAPQADGSVVQVTMYSADGVTTSGRIDGRKWHATKGNESAPVDCDKLAALTEGGFLVNAAAEMQHAIHVRGVLRGWALAFMQGTFVEAEMCSYTWTTRSNPSTTSGRAMLLALTDGITSTADYKALDAAAPERPEPKPLPSGGTAGD